ncbi:MAG: DUF4349 domain-containing protein [Phormidesmis sp.]
MKRLGLVCLISSVFALSTLTGCAQSPLESTEQTEADVVSQPAPQAATSAQSNPVADGEMASEIANEVARDTTDGTVAPQPQLVKRAHLALSVDSVEESFEQVGAIVRSQNGDVLSMQDYGDRQRSVDFELRVPQEKLDATLAALIEMGTVRSRSLTTEDVSSQLVDLKARLSNARKSEAALQEIMSRSGEIADVLAVSQELGTVRQSIEQMAATQKNLQTQVSYSTVTLSLQSAIAASPNQPGVVTQLATSWNQATDSVGDFTTDLLQLGLWLLVYSPYWLLLAGGAMLANKAHQKNKARRRNASS